MLRINKISRLISIIILTIIVSVFIDSELIENCSKWNTAQDYCEIVKGATQGSKDLTKDLFKLQLDKSICFHCIDETKQVTNAFTVLDSEHFHTPQKTTEVYLFNRTFLI